MASQPPLTSVLMDIRVSILCSRLYAVTTVFSLLLICGGNALKRSFHSVTGRNACIYRTLVLSHRDTDSASNFRSPTLQITGGEESKDHDNDVITQHNYWIIVDT